MLTHPNHMICFCLVAACRYGDDGDDWNSNRSSSGSNEVHHYVHHVVLLLHDLKAWEAHRKRSREQTPERMVGLHSGYPCPRCRQASGQLYRNLASSCFLFP
jgi:hypothetical protein